MSTRLVVNSSNELTEQRMPDNNQPAAVRVAANIISYIFHPVFVPVYVVLFLLYIHPFMFVGYSSFEKVKVLIQSFLMYSFFPLITVLLLRALNFIPTILLKTQKERFIPLIAVMTCSFWIWNVWRNLPEYPHETVLLTFAFFMATIAAWLMNIYFKVSLHAIAMGVMLSFSIYLGLTGSFNMGIYISLALIITGLVCTARLIVSDHSSKEIYAGLAGGILAFFTAILFA
ncbi:MAG TPA: hypothetical protein VF476_03160 [Chitinophagaceae bacterium]